jgi:hypothetical protein
MFIINGGYNEFVPILTDFVLLLCKLVIITSVHTIAACEIVLNGQLENEHFKTD